MTLDDIHSAHRFIDTLEKSLAADARRGDWANSSYFDAAAHFSTKTRQGWCGTRRMLPGENTQLTAITASSAMKTVAHGWLASGQFCKMTPQEFEARIAGWAGRQGQLDALIQFGSRVQAEGMADEHSDWDFHLIASQPSCYRDIGWLGLIAPVWCACLERTPRGSWKVSATFENAFEADFVLLSAWQMKLVYWAMNYPHWAKYMPFRLRHGVTETREILLNSGYRVWIGGQGWKARLRALNTSWPIPRMKVAEFANHTAAFWQKAVWVSKKIARPEPRSAMHWMHKLVLEHVYALLEEEAWLAGKRARPDALKAEKWLDQERMQQTAMQTSLDPRILAQALLENIELFEELSKNVSRAGSLPLTDYSSVAAWLRRELAAIKSR